MFPHPEFTRCGYVAHQLSFRRWIHTSKTWTWKMACRISGRGRSKRMRKNAKSISLRWSPPKDLWAIEALKWFGFSKWYGMVWSLWWASSKSQNHFVLSIFISSWRISSWVELQTCISGSSTNLSFMIHMLVRGYNFGWLISCQKLLDVHLQFIYLFVLFVWA